MADGYKDDAMLIGRAQRGDGDALDSLIRKHETRAYQYAYRLTRNAEEASDVVAEAFVRVYNAIHNFKGQSAFTTWLYRILTNCFLDIRKKERSRPFTSLESSGYNVEGELERQVEFRGRGPFEETERQAKESAMQSAVSKLPEYQRAIILMYHIEMLSYEEMAMALDLPIGTVKSRLNRARISLRESLKDQRELFSLVS